MNVCDIGRLIAFNSGAKGCVMPVNIMIVFCINDTLGCLGLAKEDLQ